MINVDLESGVGSEKFQGLQDEQKKKKTKKKANI